MLEKIRFEAKNKQSETYVIVLSDPLERREEGIKKQTKQQSGKKTAEEKKGEITKIKNITRTLLSHAKNISRTCQTHNWQMKTITLLSRGLKFIPVPVTRENLIRRQLFATLLLADFNEFARRMRLQYIFYRQEKEPHPFRVK